jgi:hypothetical protein
VTRRIFVVVACHSVIGIIPMSVENNPNNEAGVIGWLLSHRRQQQQQFD